jgi:N-acetyl-anhydromuramoyl-L-alanine amidase
MAPTDRPAAGAYGWRDGWRDGWWLAAGHCPSPNHGPRPPGSAVTLVVLHAISLPPGRYGGDAVARLFTNRLDCDTHPYFAQLRGLAVSAHFWVRRDGAVLQFVSCDRRAWHAGTSSWNGRDNCNDWSIGIELEGLDGEVFEPMQYAALARLLQVLGERYPLHDVVGHEHVAPGRKHDPGAGFRWDRLHSETSLTSGWHARPGHPGLVRPADPNRR